MRRTLTAEQFLNEAYKLAQDTANSTKWLGAWRAPLTVTRFRHSRECDSVQIGMRDDAKPDTPSALVFITAHIERTEHVERARVYIRYDSPRPGGRYQSQEGPANQSCLDFLEECLLDLEAYDITGG